MAVITAPLLGSINNGVSLAYNTQFWAAEGIYKAFTFVSPSTGAEEIYPRLDMLPGLREWVGDRVVHGVSEQSFRVRNRAFEETIGINRYDIEDDKYGLLTPIAQQLGENAGRFPDLLVAQQMQLGHTTPTYDGQNFFDVAHPNPTPAGGAGTIANYQDGASPVWYLIDDTRVLKPFIWQTRRPFQIIPKFRMDDEQVFWEREFQWGVDGRCNFGLGLWQLAFMSRAALTHDNVLAARTAMASIRRADGAPMGINGRLIVTGSAN